MPNCQKPCFEAVKFEVKKAHFWQLSPLIPRIRIQREVCSYFINFRCAHIAWIKDVIIGHSLSLFSKWFATVCAGWLLLLLTNKFLCFCISTAWITNNPGLDINIIYWCCTQLWLFVSNYIFFQSIPWVSGVFIPLVLQCRFYYNELTLVIHSSSVWSISINTMQQYVFFNSIWAFKCLHSVV